MVRKILNFRNRTYYCLFLTVFWVHEEEKIECKIKISSTNYFGQFDKNEIREDKGWTDLDTMVNL